MYKLFWTIVWRNTLKQKNFVLIKTLGLSMGIGCCLLANLHVRSELSYDDFHRNGASIFRVIRILYSQQGYTIRHRDPDLPSQMGSLLPTFFPEILSQTRFADFVSGVVASNDRPFQEVLSMADRSFFQIFSFPLLAGDPATVLSRDSDIVLTESCARKYFGDGYPIGQRLTITCGDIRKDFFVSGIAADPPKNSIFAFSLVLPISNLPAFLDMPELLTGWNPGVWPIPVYVLLKPGVGAADLEKRFGAFTAQYFDPEIKAARADGWSRPDIPFSFGLQNIRNVYLDSSVYLGKGMAECLVLSGIVLLILIMAGINFTNLSLGTASFRAKEIGIRKVIGAQRHQLIWQLWGETLISVGGATLVGIGLAVLSLPAFNQLVAKSYMWGDFLSLPNALAASFLVLLVWAMTATYPSLVMTSLQPADILRGRFKLSRKRCSTSALIVFQFALSTILVISALVFQKQMKALSEKDLGYRHEGLLAIKTQDSGVESSRDLVALYRERIVRNPRVLGVTACSTAFGLSPAPRQDTDRIDLHWNAADADFIRTIGAGVVLGEDFRSDHAGNAGTVLVNERFVRAFRLSTPIGMSIGRAIALHEPGYGVPDELTSLVIRGVIKDLHFAPLSYGIFPAVIHVQPTAAYSRVLVRVSKNDLTETLGFLKAQWREIRPNMPFVFYFQDEALGNLLWAERRWTRIAFICSVLAILLACMGVFGLTSISMNARVKEIGIRKVLGASALRITVDIYRDLLGPVAMAVALACPAALILLNEALRRFPYRIEIPGSDLLAGGFLTLTIAVATTLVLVLSAAGASPVVTLRRE